MEGTISPNENWLVTILGITEPTYTGGQRIKVMINSSKEKFGLYPLMTPGLSKTFGVMYTSTCLNLQITRSDIRTHTYKADCQPGDCIYMPHGHCNLPEGFEWVYMD